MSKIEKALTRARSERKLSVVPASPKKSTEIATRAALPAAATGAELEARARASDAIVAMREVALRTRSELEAVRVISPEMGENPTVKAFREIRTKVLQKTMGSNAVVMVTGVTAQSGTTFVSVNLGAAFAFDEGKTALVIDCNLRNPQLQRLVRGENPPGLADYLENPDMDAAEIIHSVGIERLRVITAGGRREAPGEYFTSEKMKRLLETIRCRYPERFIIVDSPPMTDSADTQILADLCDYFILVVPYGTVTRSQLDMCVKAMDRNKLIGMVFNNEPRLPDLPKKKKN